MTRVSATTARSAVKLSPFRRQHLAFVLVMVVVVVGLGRIAQYHWRDGTVIVAASLLLAALLRLVLPSDRAGLLAVRSRLLDAVTYTGFGVAILTVALTITGGPLD
jgi:peptidoglycan/LPS O-acetylase OafA/YrhL